MQTFGRFERRRLPPEPGRPREDNEDSFQATLGIHEQTARWCWPNAVRRADHDGRRDFRWMPLAGDPGVRRRRSARLPIARFARRATTRSGRGVHRDRPGIFWYSRAAERSKAKRIARSRPCISIPASTLRIRRPRRRRSPARPARDGAHRAIATASASRGNGLTRVRKEAIVRAVIPSLSRDRLDLSADWFVAAMLLQQIDHSVLMIHPGILQRSYAVSRLGIYVGAALQQHRRRWRRTSLVLPRMRLQNARCRMKRRFAAGGCHIRVRAVFQQELDNVGRLRHPRPTMIPLHLCFASSRAFGRAAWQGALEVWRHSRYPQHLLGLHMTVGH